MHISCEYQWRPSPVSVGYLNGGEVIQINLLHSKNEYLSMPLSKAHVNPLKSIEENK